jgi:hypothetical protein
MVLLHMVFRRAPSAGPSSWRRSHTPGSEQSLRPRWVTGGQTARKVPRATAFPIWSRTRAAFWMRGAEHGHLVGLGADGPGRRRCTGSGCTPTIPEHLVEAYVRASRAQAVDRRSQLLLPPTWVAMPRPCSGE